VPTEKEIWKKKSRNKTCVLAQQNGFDPTFFHMMLRLVKGTAEPNT
jgi:hypothetical protein